MDLEHSPAWAALPRSARKVYTAIMTEIAKAGGDSAPCTYDDLMLNYNCGSPPQALQVLRYLRLIEVTPGKPSVYRLSNGWREIVDQAQAEKLIAAAREIRSRDSGPLLR